MELPRRWLEHTPVGIYDHLEPPREYVLFTCARVLLAGGEVDRALILLQRLHTYAETVDILPARLEALCLLALAYRAAGETGPALAALREALEPGAAEGYLRAFIDEGAPMAELLSALLRRRAGRGPGPGGPSPAYLRKLSTHCRLRLVNRSKTRLPEHPVQLLVEPLTGREEVLRPWRRASPMRRSPGSSPLPEHGHGAPAQHFDKLGVRSRAEAVHRARELGLLPR